MVLLPQPQSLLSPHRVEIELEASLRLEPIELAEELEHRKISEKYACVTLL